MDLQNGRTWGLRTMKFPYPVPEAPGPPCSQMMSGSWKMVCRSQPVQGSRILQHRLRAEPRHFVQRCAR